MAGISPDPANILTRPSATDFVLGRLVANSSIRTDLRENLSELFKPSARDAIRSGLLVEWDSRSANFRRNLSHALRDAFISPLFTPIATGANESAVPEIWAKRTLLKRVQSLSLSYHIVFLAFVVAPFLPELVAPSATQAKSGPWISTPLIAPRVRVPAATSKPAHGGGSGGERDPLPATRGRVPVFRHIQLAPPSAHPPQNAAFSVPPTLIGPEGLSVESPNISTWGDPASPSSNDSSGPGHGGGIGDREGGGIGNGGEGPGYGPGKGGGTGDSEYNAGVNGVGYPICIYCPNPQFSEEAVKAKYQGIVLLSATITADGRVTNVRIVKGLGAGLDEMAIATVRTWRFRPALGPDRQPVAVNAPIEVTFRLY